MMWAGRRAESAHERAFTHFGGCTQEHLYDRPRTVCAPRGSGGVRWNTTFKAFADWAHSRFPGHALTPTGVMAIRCKQFHLPDL